MDSEGILAGLVRIGTVTAVDQNGRMVRVQYQDTEITSGWLRVLQHSSIWMPSVNDIVVVLYLPVFNADGFVLGGT